MEEKSYSDSADSLFLTQSVTSASRTVRRRRPSDPQECPFSQPSEDEQKTAQCGDPTAKSDSDSETSITELLRRWRSPTRTRGRISRRHRRVAKKIEFPFLKKFGTGKLSIRKNHTIVNSEIGGFFKCLQKLSKGHGEKRRRELSPSMLPPDWEKEEGDEDEDIRKVDMDCFILGANKRNRQAWLPLLKQKTEQKTRKCTEKSKTNQDQQVKSFKTTRKMAEDPIESQDSTDITNQSSSSTEEEPLPKKRGEKSGKTSTKSSVSLRSTTSPRKSSFVQSLFMDSQEKHIENQPQVLVQCSQSLDWHQTQKADKAPKNLMKPTDEMAVQETQLASSDQDEDETKILVNNPTDDSGEDFGGDSGGFLSSQDLFQEPDNRASLSKDNEEIFESRVALNDIIKRDSFISADNYDISVTHVYPFILESRVVLHDIMKHKNKSCSFILADMTADHAKYSESQMTETCKISPKARAIDQEREEKDKNTSDDISVEQVPPSIFESSLVLHDIMTDDQAKYSEFQMTETCKISPKARAIDQEREEKDKKTSDDISVEQVPPSIFESSLVLHDIMKDDQAKYSEFQMTETCKISPKARAIDQEREEKDKNTSDDISVEQVPPSIFESSLVLHDIMKDDQAKYSEFQMIETCKISPKARAIDQEREEKDKNTSDDISVEQVPPSIFESSLVLHDIMKDDQAKYSEFQMTETCKISPKARAIDQEREEKDKNTSDDISVEQVPPSIFESSLVLHDIMTDDQAKYSEFQMTETCKISPKARAIDQEREEKDKNTSDDISVEQVPPSIFESSLVLHDIMKADHAKYSESQMTETCKISPKARAIDQEREEKDKKTSDDINVEQVPPSIFESSVVLHDIMKADHAKYSESQMTETCKISPKARAIDQEREEKDKKTSDDINVEQVPPSIFESSVVLHDIMKADHAKYSESQMTETCKISPKARAIDQEREEKDKKTSDDISVEHPHPSSPIKDSTTGNNYLSPFKDVLSVSQETNMDSPLFNYGGMTLLKRRNGEKTKAPGLDDNPPPIQAAPDQNEGSAPHIDDTIMQKESRNVKNDGLSENPTDTLPEIHVRGEIIRVGTGFSASVSGLEQKQKTKEDKNDGLSEEPVGTLPEISVSADSVQSVQDISVVCPSVGENNSKKKRKKGKNDELSEEPVGTLPEISVSADSVQSVQDISVVCPSVGENNSKKKRKKGKNDGLSEEPVGTLPEISVSADSVQSVQDISVVCPSVGENNSKKKRKKGKNDGLSEEPVGTLPEISVSADSVQSVQDISVVCPSVGENNSKKKRKKGKNDGLSEDPDDIMQEINVSADISLSVQDSLVHCSSVGRSKPKKKRKNDKYGETLLNGDQSTGEETIQIPCQGPASLLSITKETKQLTGNDYSSHELNQLDSHTQAHDDLVQSDGLEPRKKKKKKMKKRDSSLVMADAVVASQCSEEISVSAHSNLSVQDSVDCASVGGSKLKKRRKKGKNDERLAEPVDILEQMSISADSTSSVQDSSVDRASGGGSKPKKKRKTERSAEPEEGKAIQIPCPGSASLVSITEETVQLSDNVVNQLDIHTQVHHVQSDGPEPRRKKKKKRRDSSPEMTNEIVASQCSEEISVSAHSNLSVLDSSVDCASVGGSKLKKKRKKGKNDERLVEPVQEISVSADPVLPIKDFSLDCASNCGSKLKKKRKKDKNDERLAEPVDILKQMSISADSTSSVQDSSVDRASGGGSKPKKKRKTERSAEPEEGKAIQIPCPGSASLVSITEETVQLSDNVVNQLDIHTQVHHVQSDGPESRRKKKRRDSSPEMTNEIVASQCSEEISVSAHSNRSVPGSSVDCASGGGSKPKKKRKKQRSAEPEEGKAIQIPCPGSASLVSITEETVQLSDNVVNQLDIHTQVHHVQSDGPEPRRKKKKKRRDSSPEMTNEIVASQCSEESYLNPGTKTVKKKKQKFIDDVEELSLEEPSDKTLDIPAGVEIQPVDNVDLTTKSSGTPRKKKKKKPKVVREENVDAEASSAAIQKQVQAQNAEEVVQEKKVENQKKKKKHRSETRHEEEENASLSLGPELGVTPRSNTPSTRSESGRTGEEEGLAKSKLVKKKKKTKELESDGRSVSHGSDYLDDSYWHNTDQTTRVKEVASGGRKHHAACSEIQLTNKRKEGKKHEGAKSDSSESSQVPQSEDTIPLKRKKKKQRLVQPDVDKKAEIVELDIFQENGSPSETSAATIKKKKKKKRKDTDEKYRTILY